MIKFLKPERTGIRKLFGGLKTKAPTRKALAAVKPVVIKPLPPLPEDAELAAIDYDAVPEGKHLLSFNGATKANEPPAEHFTIHETEPKYPTLVFPPPVLSPTQGSIDHIFTGSFVQDTEGDESVYEDIDIDENEGLSSPTTLLRQIEFPYPTANLVNNGMSFCALVKCHF